MCWACRRDSWHSTVWLGWRSRLPSADASECAGSTLSKTTLAYLIGIDSEADNDLTLA